MPYRRTGRTPGRPRNPVTPEGRLERARQTLPHVRAFPHLRRAVDRAMRAPNSTVLRVPNIDTRDVDVEHRYTPAERGQTLAFVWWVYANRMSWTRAKLAASITSISPLMLFSSTFFADMTGLPKDTATKHMIKAPDMEVKRVTGTCDVWVVHQLLEVATMGMDRYRDYVRELSISKGVPQAMLSRVSGVPREIILRPDRGVQFFPEECDLAAGRICSPIQVEDYRKDTKEKKASYDPNPGNQFSVRYSFAGTALGAIYTTSTPLPGEAGVPYHTAIPGLPTIRDAARLGSKFYEQLHEWEFRYQLPAAPYVGLEEESQLG